MVCVLVVLAFPATSTSQVPGTPVLQNAFGSPGLAVAANFGGGPGQGFGGAAVGWGLASGRLQVSGAVGVQRRRDESRGAYGGRLSGALWTTSGRPGWGGAFGVGGFVGVGGAAGTHTDDVVTNPSVVAVPAGISLGYRRAIGRTRGVSVYATPFYRWTRVDSVETENLSAFAVATGVDFAFSPSVGATIGVEFSSSDARGGGNERGAATFGAAIGFAPRRR